MLNPLFCLTRQHIGFYSRSYGLVFLYGFFTNPMYAPIPLNPALPTCYHSINGDNEASGENFGEDKNTFFGQIPHHLGRYYHFPYHFKYNLADLQYSAPDMGQFRSHSPFLHFYRQNSRVFRWPRKFNIPHQSFHILSSVLALSW